MARNAFTIPGGAAPIFSLPILVAGPLFANGDTTAGFWAYG